MENWKKTFYATWLAQFFAMVGFSFVFPYLAFFIQTELQTPKDQVAVLTGYSTAVMGFTMAFFAPIWGVLADRYGRKPMVLRSMYGGAAVLTLMGMVTSVHQLIALRMMQGMFTGTISANLALVSANTPRHRTTFALSMMQAAVLIGNCIGPALGSEAALLFGRRPAFYIAGGMLLIAGVLVHLLVRERFERAPASGNHVAGEYLAILRRPGFIVAIVALTLVQFSMAAPGSFIAPLVEQMVGDEGRAMRLTGQMLTLAGLVAAISAAGLGYVAEDIGRRRLLVGSALVSGLISILHLYAQTVAPLFALRVGFALAAAAIIPSANAIIQSVVPRDSLGKAYGLVASLSCLGIALGPATAGHFVQSFGNDYRIPFVIAGIGLWAVMAMALFGLRAESPSPGPAASSVPVAESAPEPVDPD